MLQIANPSGSTTQYITTQLYESAKKPGFSIDLDWVLLLDTGATVKATMKNPALVWNIRMAKQPMDMAMNHGSKMLQLEADIPIGMGYFDTDLLANIVGFYYMKEMGWHIQYDSKIDDIFHCRKDGLYMPFKRSPEGFYYYEPTQEYIDQVAKFKGMVPTKVPSLPAKDYRSDVVASNAITTVEDNRKGFTTREFEGAKKARKMLHILGFPMVENLKHIIQQKIIKNCQVTVDKMNNAEKIFGPDIGSMKGKGTRQRPRPLREEIIENPAEILEQHSELTLSMDIFYVNKMPNLTAIDRSIRYRSLVNMGNREKEEIYSALDKILCNYNATGFVMASLSI